MRNPRVTKGGKDRTFPFKTGRRGREKCMFKSIGDKEKLPNKKSRALGGKSLEGPGEVGKQRCMKR